MDPHTSSEESVADPKHPILSDWGTHAQLPSGRWQASYVDWSGTVHRSLIKHDTRERAQSWLDRRRGRGPDVTELFERIHQMSPEAQHHD